MKKTKKALASLAIAGMLATMIPFNALATVPDMGTRIAGYTAYETAQQISLQTEAADSVVLAAGMSRNSVDALAAGPLAKQLNAPILLTDGDGTLTAEAKAELTRLMPKKVYVTSGTAVILPAALAEVEAITGVGTVVALGGFDAYETSLKIAKQMVALGANPTGIVVAGGWASPADALSAASIAAAKGMPILAVAKDGLSVAQKAFVATLTGITKSYIVGGTAVVDASVEATLPGTVVRLAGQTQYDTNLKVLQNFTDVNYDKVFVANGRTFVDALAGAPLAAKYGAPIVLADGVADPTLAAYVYGKMDSESQVIALGGTAAIPQSVLDAVNSGATVPTGDLSVTSVSAVTANSFKVVFNQAPADTTKVTFAVARSTTPVTVSATWNTAKTEATVSSATNFPEGSYTVAVKNGETALGTSTVAITQQKIAKINITSNKLSISGNYDPVPASNLQRGYLTYTVEDQYGNDITTSYLANTVTFQSGVISSYTAKNGVVTIKPNINLIQFASVVVTAYETTNGISTSANLTTSTAMGTLSNMTLNTMSNADGKVLTAADQTSVFYIDYTATDISGNPTKDLNLVKGGLILGVGDTLTNSASSYVKASVEADPSDSNKAVIKVQVTSATDISMDIPVAITAMTYSGTSSTFNTTLKKAATVDTFTVMAPSYDIAINETKEIPFVAYDQNGVAITKASELTTVTFSPGGGTTVKLTTKVDGTAALMVGTFPSDGPQVITAMTNTGKISSVTLNIQKAAVADTLTLDNSLLVSAMQAGAKQRLDFGPNYGGFAAKDQYGRVLDLVKATADYEVVATVTGNVAVTGFAPNKTTETVGIPVAFGGNSIEIQAGAAGTGTVTFNLIKKTDRAAFMGGDTSKVISSKSATMSVIADKDIKGYTIDAVATPIYAHSSVLAGAAVTPQAAAYEANPEVFGKTSSGSKVLLAGTPIIGAYVDNTNEFATDNAAGALAYDGVNVFAGKLEANKTEASTNLTVTIQNPFDNSISSLTTPIKSATVSPVAKNLVVSAATFSTGVVKDSTGDIIDVNAADLAVGKLLTRFDDLGSDLTRSAVYFYALDSYGTKAMPISQIILVSQTGSGTFALNTTTKRVTAAPAVNDVITLSAVTSNGLVKTIKLNVK